MSLRQGYEKEYYRKNRSRILLIHKKWKKQNPEKVKGWKVKNKERVRETNRKSQHKCYWANLSKHRANARLEVKKYAEKRKACIKRFRKTTRGRFDNLRGNASARGIPLLVSFQEYEILIKNHCYYCGRENDTKGLDRVDYNIGYEINNVVSCCGQCNLAKHVKTKSQFIEMCLLVAERYKAGVIV